MASIDITYAYAKTRFQFGRQCKFVEKAAELVTTIEPELELTANFIARTPINRATQCSEPVSLQEVSMFVIMKRPKSKKSYCVRKGYKMSAALA